LISKEDIGNPILNGILFQQIFTFLNQVWIVLLCFHKLH
jgi:hypothetical protein